MEKFFDLLISGLATGSLYTLLALAVVIIVKGTDVPNFAQGEMAMVSAVVAFVLVNDVGLPYILAFLLAVMSGAVVAAASELLLVRPISHSPMLSMVMLTFGLMIVLNSSTTLLWGPEIHVFKAPYPTSPITLGGVVISSQSLVIMGVAAMMVVLLLAFFYRTSLGLHMRAVQQDRVLALLMGISVGWIFTLSWGLSGAVGAVAGIMTAHVVFLSVDLMANFLLKSFVAAAMGGFTSIGGAIIGGLMLGVIENMVGGYVSLAWKDAVAFILVALVLIIRPQGILGSYVIRKV